VVTFAETALRKVVGERRRLCGANRTYRKTACALNQHLRRGQPVATLPPTRLFISCTVHEAGHSDS
jgi:hypothetical protein